MELYQLTDVDCGFAINFFSVYLVKIPGLYSEPGKTSKMELFANIINS